MSYLIGTGDVSISDVNVTNAIVFNSTKYPGTCKPSNSYTLGVFKELQRQLNRVATRFTNPLPKVAIDGDIGPGTVDLAYKAIGAPPSCTTIATNALGYTAQAKSMADNAGVPATISQPTSSKPSTVVDAATGVESLAPSSGIAGSVSDALANMSSTQKLAGLVILGGLAYVMLKKPKAKTSRRG